jgi:hypothetical protein
MCIVGFHATWRVPGREVIFSKFVSWKYLVAEREGAGRRVVGSEGEGEGAAGGT